MRLRRRRPPTQSSCQQDSPPNRDEGTALNDDKNHDAKVIAFSKSYLLDFEREEAKAKDSGELIAAMQKLYPDAQLGIALQLGAKVAQGEMTW